MGKVKSIFKELHKNKVLYLMMVPTIIWVAVFCYVPMYGVLIALVHEMTFFLQMGHTVKLDGFGNFHLTIESETVDQKSDYRLKEHVKRVKCKFTPAAHRITGRKLSYYFCEGAKLELKKG